MVSSLHEYEQVVVPLHRHPFIHIGLDSFLAAPFPKGLQESNKSQYLNWNTFLSPVRVVMSAPSRANGGLHELNRKSATPKNIVADPLAPSPANDTQAEGGQKSDRTWCRDERDDQSNVWH